ncbi:MAG TPA: HD domain-containing protein [Actinoplanes sp.]|jgi:hypothetical protein
MNDILALPAGPVAEASLALVRTTESGPLVQHSIRSFLFARLIAGQQGVPYEEDLLFAACVLHDVGLGTFSAGRARFEVEGADLAAALLGGQGVARADVDRVWEAIALHASPGIADRMGPLAYLTYQGSFTDASGNAGGLSAASRERVYAAYPRPADDTSIRDAIAAHAARSEAAAPPFSISAEFLRQRNAARA